MTTKISTLPTLTTVTDATIIPVVEGGATKRITGLALKTYTGTAAGPQGPSGPSGPSGAAGSNGASGPSGPSGPGTLNSGTAGYIPYYSASTTLSSSGSGGLFYDSTNSRLGIGTATPAVPLEIDKSSGEALRFAATGANQNIYARYITGSPGVGNVYVGVDSAAGGITGVGNAGYIWNAGNAGVAIGTNNSLKLTVDASGNTGLGVAPSSGTGWASNFELLSTSNIVNQGTDFSVGSNWYYNSGYLRKSAGAVSNIYLKDGTIRFQYAASSTAGSSFSFSEAARIDATGLVMVGRTSNINSADKFVLSGQTQSVPLVQLSADWASQPVAAGSTVLRVSGNMNSGNDAQLLWLEHTNPFGSTSYAFGAIKVTGNTYAAAQNVFGVDPGTGMTTISRTRNDGTLMDFQRAGSSQGSIYLSGSTVSYNSFAGSHWSQWLEGRGHTPEIPRGTVLSTIDEMCVWKSLQWMEDYESHNPDDQNGQIIEATTIGQEGNTPLSTKKQMQHAKPYMGTEPIGAIVIEDGIEKIVIDDGNERLPKVKISDVVGDKRVYGVFMDYDNVQDIHVTAIGAFVVRIAAGVNVTAGDLLESNGDGCARVQNDDLIRSSTIGKVTTSIKIAQYDDGSYTVPCVLFCG